MKMRLVLEKSISVVFLITIAEILSSRDRMYRFLFQFESFLQDIPLIDFQYYCTQMF